MFLKMLIYFFQFQDSEPQTCSKCNKNIVGLVNLMDHFNKDHGLIDNQWQCPICPKNFKDRIGAWRHVRADHLNIMKKCHECGVSLPLRKFKHHKNKMHGKLYKCDLCDHSTTLKSSYDRHIRVMHSKMEKQFLCDQCEQKFNYAYQLRDHKDKVHDGISKKTLSCDQCDKKFQYPHEVKNHKNVVHLGIEKEKAHACDLCNKRFAVPCLLRDHKDSVHNGIRKSQLGSKSNIKKENTVQEPMECKSCTITFKFPSIYIKHYQDKHGTLPPEYVDKENFICDQCPSVFISKQNLRDHILRVHMKKKKKTYRNTENGMEYIDAIKCTSCKQGNLLRGIDN